MTNIFEYRAPGSKADLHLLFEDMKNKFPWRPVGKKSRPVGKKSPAYHTRQECFAGAVIGLDDRERINPSRSMRTSEGRIVKFNDPYCKTRFDEFEKLAECRLPERSRASFLAICDDAFKRLKASLLQSGNSGEELARELMQCNVNMYRKEDFMPWHRDDVTINDMPEINTFHPASLTCILTNKSIADREEVGLRVALPASAGKAVQTISNRPEFAEKPIFRGFHGSMILLSGAAYTEGLHTAGSNWESESSDFERITMNFRLVLPEVWAELHREGY